MQQARYDHRMRYRYLLFDLDGTLADTLRDIAASVNAARAGIDLPPLADAAVRGCIGDGLGMLIERTIPQAHRTQATALFRTHYAAHLLDATRAYAGIPEVLAELRKAGVKIAVVTNKPQAFAGPILEGLGLASCGEVVLGGDSPHGKKPAPEPLRFALRALGWDAEAEGLSAALVIGDGRNDILGARNAGLAVCAVGWGFGTAAELRALGPDFLIEKPAELLELVR